MCLLFFYFMEHSPFFIWVLFMPSLLEGGVRHESFVVVAFGAGELIKILEELSSLR